MSILGAILLNQKAYDDAAACGLQFGDFSLDSHRRIYHHMAVLAESGRPIDHITLIDQLRLAKDLERVGDFAYIADLPVGVPDRPSIKYYVRIVKEKAAQRKVIAACNAAAGVAEEMTSGDAMSYLQDQILQIQTGSDDSPAEHVIQFSDRVFSEWERQAQDTDQLIGLSTGLDPIDTATTGIRPGELWLYAGRTGDGKTSLALQAAAENCRKDIPVGLFSLEMAKADLLTRLWAQAGNISFQHIRNPRRLESEMRNRIQRAMCTVGKLPLYVVDDSSLSIQKLVAKARLLIRQEKVKLLIVDYVQLLSAAAKDERERMTKISNALRALAKDTGVPIIAVSQLSRPKDGSLNARPNKFSLKESGSLENDAHVIILTYRPVDDFGNPTGEDELIIAKQRHGPVGNERVVFDSNTLIFRERSRVAFHVGAQNI
jgi:replicative DNA helicase